VTGNLLTVTIGFEEPGGRVNYSYKATNPTTKIAFSFKGSDEIGKQPNHYRITIDGSGAFKAIGAAGQNNPSEDEHGELVYSEFRGGEVRRAHATLVSATYTDSKKLAHLFFRVTQSNLGCAPVRRHIDVIAANKRYLTFQICRVNDTLEIAEED